MTNNNIKQGVGLTAIAAIILFAVSLILLSYFVIIPAAAEYVATKVPISYEISLGEKIFTQMEAEGTVDKEKTLLANRFFEALNIKSNYAIKITVIDDKVDNAFALPGGHIVVYSAILKHMKSEEEFAALLCHEYSHVNAKHTTRSLFRSLGTYMVLSIVLSDINGIMGVLIENAHQLKSLSYSRKLEQEADDKGLQLMINANVNPNGMIQLFKHLKEASKESMEVPEFLSTHPMLDERIKNIEKNNSTLISEGKSNSELKEIWEEMSK